MPVYEFHITVFNKENGPEGALRHDEGDIINVRESGVEIGRKVLDYFLIVPVSMNLAMTALELKQWLCIPLYEDGTKEGIHWRMIDYENDGVDIGLYPPRDYVWSLTIPGVISRPQRIAKCRYQVPLDRFDAVSLDGTKLADIECLYQPFLSQSRIANLPCFNQLDADYEISGTSINGNPLIRQKRKFVRNIYEETIGGKLIRYIRPKEPAIEVILTDEPEYELFNDTPIIGKETEHVIALAPNTQFIRDKYDNSFLKVKDIGQ